MAPGQKLSHSRANSAILKTEAPTAIVLDLVAEWIDEPLSQPDNPDTPNDS